MATFLVAHGAWSAGWAWKKMHPLLQARGHELITPTYTGIGERSHLAGREINLSTHIEDMLQVIRFEDLADVILIGHSYGGMVATGAADRMPDRIAKLIYIDAFVPRDGTCSFDYLPPEARARMEAGAAGGWRVPSNPVPPDTSAEDLEWISPRRVPQPIECFREPVKLQRGETKIPRSYIYAARSAPGDVFRQFAERARAEGWDYHEMDASHSPHITAPAALAEILDRIARA
jgi:pimeloyl-ACP methyl ester carboxylesterase